MRPRRLQDIGEFGLLARLLPRASIGRGTLVGPGDDCAVIRCGRQRFLFTVDALVEGAHFKDRWLTPYQLGRKSFLVNASDIAAMGGQPLCCVVALGVPGRYRAADLLRLQGGIQSAARECSAEVVGGNLARASELSITIALLGRAPRRPVTRGGARPGDRIYVTGTLGDAALGLRLLRRGRAARNPAAVRRFREPAPRLRAGGALARSGLASAMIDVSDGLLQDLRHICACSHTGAVVYGERLPLSPALQRAAVGVGRRAALALALSGGEDYELLCTIPERHVKRLARYRRRLGCRLTHIGTITTGAAVRVRADDGRTLPLATAGYDHFLTGD